VRKGFTIETRKPLDRAAAGLCGRQNQSKEAVSWVLSMGAGAMRERPRFEETNSTSKVTKLAPAVWKLFAQAHLLADEDGATYDELLARIRAAVKPVDIIDDMLIADVAALEWELLRWRRLKASLIRACGLEALKTFLCENLPATQANKEEELMQKYVRREPSAVTLVGKLLAEHNTSMDALVVKELAEKFVDIERMDRLTTIAEGRRNASLREIDRRRTVLGNVVRRTVHDLGQSDYEVIDPTSEQGKK
jgi:hypothetical protein